MIDFRPVLFTCGALLSVLAIAMIVPATVDAASGNADWRVFTLAAALTLFIGVSLVLTTRSGWSGLN
ncbi:MAG: potassium transporter TrkH, partial [Kiloniellales bacterium]